MRLDATCTTQRRGAISGIKTGDFAANLSACRIVSPMLLDAQTAQGVSKLIGLDSSSVQIFQCFSERHTHTDSATPVTQLPDIKASDTLTVGSIQYTVKWAEIWPSTISYGETLMMYLIKDVRV